MALVRDDCFIPTKDAPELGYIKESSNTQYVPDVFYKVSVRVFTLISSVRRVASSKLRDPGFKSQPGTVSGPVTIIM